MIQIHSKIVSGNKKSFFEKLLNEYGMSDLEFQSILKRMLSIFCVNREVKSEEIHSLNDAESVS